MEFIEAKILLKNLLNRIEINTDGSKQLTGVLTDDEILALHTAISLLDNPGNPPNELTSIETTQPPTKNIQSIATLNKNNNPLEGSTVNKEPLNEKPQIKLDLSVLSAPEPPENIRICLDFGTAMSKATLVQDDSESAPEEIHVLQLGIPGDQEEISEVMLISSVYIDNNGILWFGKAAVDRSMIEGADGSRQRMDNIKRRLSEAGWTEQVTPRFNPTDINITNEDMILAYLMFMSWAINNCLKDLGFPLNLPRRYAMPCLSGSKGRETESRLRQLLGEAQILADTFYSTLNNGLSLIDFLAAAQSLRQEINSYPYISTAITEPLGVAGSIMSWKSKVDMLAMVVDIGAGTSDLSLYRIHFDPDTEQNIGVEINNSSRGITEAGNHLDRILIELIIKKSGITSDDPMWVNVRSAIELQIRDLKESLFNDNFVYAQLINGMEVEIELDEFLQLNAVRQFSENLHTTMIEILESVDPSWVNWITAKPTRRLVVALTGGGSELPMAKNLAEGEIIVNGMTIPVARALPFPKWLQETNADLEDDYPRVAVSLGGARKRLIKRGASANITAGDGGLSHSLEGFY